MRAFVVTLTETADALLAVADAVAATGANLTAVSLLPGSPPRFGFTVDREDAARRALQGLGLPTVEFETIELNLANIPGEFALAAHALAEAGVPIELVLTVRATRGRTREVIAVSDIETGRLVAQRLSADVLLD